MNIRMYNCYFGDCFNIDNNLLVDCGIHTCKDQSVRDQRFNDIYLDIQNNEMDFLLSHYHVDHYNGIIYMVGKDYKFSNVYIPDIWDINGSIDAISLHLLKGILNKSILNKETSIFTFLKSICAANGKVHFVKRGTRIQDKYVALWPSEKFIKDKAEKVFKDTIDDENISENHVTQLSGFSQQLQKIVYDISDREYESGELIERLDLLEDEVSKTFNNFHNIEAKSSTKIKLKDFENNISIVFQNIDDVLNENVLFTGDFGNLKRKWRKIESNFDGNPNCKMHKLYHVIKIGHHGTGRYYHSFVRRINADSVFMIPNDGSEMKWNICSDYSLNALSTGTQVICATNNSCEAKNNNGGSCSCTNCIIIEPNIYFDVR